MVACSSGSGSDAGSGGRGADAAGGDAARGGEVATGKGGAGSGGAGSGGARTGSGGAEVAQGGSAGAESGGRGGATGGAASTGGASNGGAGGAASHGGASAGGAAGASTGGAGGAASSGGASSGGAKGGLGGAASNAGAGSGGASGAAGSTSSGPKCSTPTVVASNAVPRDANGEGQVTETNVCVPELGVISSITLKYKLSKFFGDPTRQAVFAYNADFRISNAFWVAQVMTTSGEPVMVNSKLVYVSWLEGSWPPPGGTFGTDSTGSPWWSETFSYYSGGMMRDGYVDEANAKAIYAAGFTLDRLRMVKVNGNPVLY